MRIRQVILSSLYSWSPVGFFSLALLSTPLSAQNLTGHYDSWLVMVDDSMALAFTTDGKDSAFGLVCGPECFFYIESRVACVIGRDYRVAIEAGAASRETRMTCKPAGDGPLLVMPQDEQVLKLIARQDDVRFKIERDGGETSLFRFPLRGSEPAIGMALAARAYIKPLDAAGLAPLGASPERR